MSHARREALKAAGQAKADAWNAKYPVGTPVTAYPMVRPEDPIAVAHKARVASGRTYGDSDPCETLTTVTRTPAWPLGDGTPVVSVEGYAGGICLTHIDVIADTEQAAAQRSVDAQFPIIAAFLADGGAR